MLANWIPDGDPAPEPDHPHLRVPALSTHDLLETSFIRWHGREQWILQVPVHIQKALSALVGMSPDRFEVSARQVSQVVTDHANVALMLPAEKSAVEC